MLLSDMTVRRTKATGKPYDLHDALGLYLAVTANGGKSWHFRCYWHHKRKRMSFGAYPELRWPFGLSDALDVAKRREMRYREYGGSRHRLGGTAVLGDGKALRCSRADAWARAASAGTRGACPCLAEDTEWTATWLVSLCHSLLLSGTFVRSTSSI